jgi:hypothetical protein
MNTLKVIAFGFYLNVCCESIKIICKKKIIINSMKYSFLLSIFMFHSALNKGKHEYLYKELKSIRKKSPLFGGLF